MRKLTLFGVVVLSRLAIGLALTGPAHAAVSDGAHVGRAQSLLVADAEGSGADARANTRMVAMVAQGGYGNRAQNFLFADAEGSGTDVQANTRMVT